MGTLARARASSEESENDSADEAEIKQAAPATAVEKGEENKNKNKDSGTIDAPQYDGRVPANLPGAAQLGENDPRCKYAQSHETFMEGFSRYVHLRTKIATASKKAQLISTANEFLRGGSHSYGKVGEPPGSRNVMLLGGFVMGTTDSPERDAYIKRISRNAVKDKSQGYFKLTYNHLLEFERWVMAGEPEREDEADKPTEVVAPRAPKRQRSKDSGPYAPNDVRARYANYVKRRSLGEDVDALLRHGSASPCEDEEERPVIYLMRLMGTGSMVWYDRVTDTFTSKTPIYAIGVCLHGGRKRQQRLQATCGTGEWRLRHIADVSFDRMQFANVLIHERLKNYGGLHSTPQRRGEMGIAPMSADCFCLHGRDEYDQAVSVINETCEALRATEDDGAHADDRQMS